MVVLCFLPSHGAAWLPLYTHSFIFGHPIEWLVYTINNSNQKKLIILSCCIVTASMILDFCVLRFAIFLSLSSHTPHPPSSTRHSGPLYYSTNHSHRDPQKPVVLVCRVSCVCCNRRWRKAGVFTCCFVRSSPSCPLYFALALCYTSSAFNCPDSPVRSSCTTRFNASVNSQKHFAHSQNCDPLSTRFIL